MNGLQQVIYDVSRVLLWPVLVAALVCLVWVLIESGFLLYELYLRFRYRDLDALEARTLRARRAFQDGKPRTAYRYLQENNYSIVVARFLFDLIRNYQTERLAAKPLKLLQEYEFYTVKRLERTRILVRVGPILGLMGTLIPLSPALIGLANGDTTQLAESLTTAFSVTVLGLLIGGIAFVISIVRDRMYSQDISDMEYLLELLEGGTERLQSGRRRNKNGIWDADPVVEYEAVEDADKTMMMPVFLETPRQPLVPFASGDGGGRAPVVVAPAAVMAPGAPQTDATTVDPLAAAAEPPAASPTPAAGESLPLTFDDPATHWQRDEDPFADLGPVDPKPPAGGAVAPGAGAPPSHR
ncbi:MAG: MotA/TolQ/ExbB proton channel family protein [Actinobacteria bacterium]|nr:MotA/TolQ/ExbB proton channel family protein [Actinomycetota bacterium]